MVAELPPATSGSSERSDVERNWANNKSAYKQTKSRLDIVVIHPLSVFFTAAAETMLLVTSCQSKFLDPTAASEVMSTYIYIY